MATETVELTAEAKIERVREIVEGWRTDDSASAIDALIEIQQVLDAE